MNFRRIWPSRYCPSCGGLMLRAGGAHGEPSLPAVLLAGSSEVVVWLGLGAGALIAHWVGKGLGVAAGFAVGTALLMVWLFVALRLEQALRMCECSDCHQLFRYGKCLPGRNPMHREG